MKVISLFTGAGGLDLGLEAAGFEARVAVEMDPHAVSTLQRNRSWKIIDRNIHRVSSKTILKRADLREGDADLLCGGPPCQPFSKSGLWVNGDTRRLDDERAGTIEQFLRVIRDTQPRAFLFENVPGFAFVDKTEALDLFLRLVDGINRETGSAYQPEAAVLNAVEYGVPQDRRRLFIVASRDGRRFHFPRPTHQRPGHNAACPDLLPPRTAWDAIGDLGNDDDPALRPSGKWAELLPSIPEGENYLYHTPRGHGLPLFGWRTRYWNFLLKLAKDRPSWTITAQPGSATGPFHWNNRRLSIAELLRLQTFPEPYHIEGGLRSGYVQVGNAVPSAMAEVLGWAIRRQLLDNDGAQDPAPTLVPAKRSQPPVAALPLPVPGRYSSLIADHGAHPGPGRGPRAVLV